MDVIIPFLVVCPLVGIAGFIDAIAGGGGLISLPAYFMAGVPVHVSLATNKLSNAMGTALATFRLAKQGYVKPRMVILPIIGGLVGSSCGAGINLFIDEGPLKILMLVILPLTAVYLMQPRSLNESSQPYSTGKTIALAVVVSICVGLYDGFYGPGTGTFLMILFTTVAHVSLRDAAGMAKCVNLTTNVSALVVFMINGQVYYLLGLAAGACNMIGAYIGVNMFTEKGAAVAKPIMLLVIGIFFVKTLWELFA